MNRDLRDKIGKELVRGLIDTLTSIKNEYGLYDGLAEELVKRRDEQVALLKEVGTNIHALLSQFKAWELRVHLDETEDEIINRWYTAEDFLDGLDDLPTNR
jgi:flagellar motor component MotA